MKQLNSEASQKDVVSCPYADNFILYHRLSRQLFLLNDSAHFVWEKMQAGIAVDNIIRSFSKAYDISPAQAARDVTA